jgi:hypothetical protein
MIRVLHTEPWSALGELEDYPSSGKWKVAAEYSSRTNDDTDLTVYATNFINYTTCFGRNGSSWPCRSSSG